MIFKDRVDAGRQLAEHLREFADRPDVTVLGIPRGGVVVAFEVATALHVALDIFLSRKLGVPGQEELAFGAVAAGDGRFLDQQIIGSAGISPAQIERITAEARETLDRRAAQYRGDRAPPEIPGRTILLVDDGIATGASIYAAIHALRLMQPARLVLAIPVAPASTCTWLRNLVDQLVCLYAPVEFHAVGQFYLNFHQVEDEEVIDLLRRAQRPSDDSGDSRASEASGNLSPPGSSGDVPERSSKAIASASASSDRQ